FMEADGAGDWRVLAWGASAFFEGGFAAAAGLVTAVAALDGPTPDLDLRPDGVTVHLRNEGGLTLDQLRMARRISAAAEELGLVADPTAVQDVNLAIDALAAAEVMPFWRAVLGYEE